MELEYDQKFEEMKKYIPFLDSMIQRLENSDLVSNSRQLDKLRSLRDILLDNKKRLRMESLVKCEQVLINLHEKIEQRYLKSMVEKENSSSDTDKTRLQAARKKLKSVVFKLNVQDNTGTLPEIARTSKVEEVCVAGSKESALFQRRPNKEISVGSSTRSVSSVTETQQSKKNYTRVLHSPGVDDDRCWSTSEKESDNVLFSRRSPRRHTPSYNKKEDRKKSKQTDKYGEAKKINITLNLSEESLSSLNNKHDIDINTLQELKSKIIDKLKNTDEVSDIILKSYKKKNKIKKKYDLEDGELSDSESEDVQSDDSSLVVMDDDKSTMNLVNKTSNDKDPRKNQIYFVINNKQTKSNICTETIDVHNPIKVDITDFENYHNEDKHNDSIENKNSNPLNERSISHAKTNDESVFTKLYSPGQSSVDEVSNSTNTNETKNKTTLNTQSNEISKQEINDNHRLISDDTENRKLSDSEIEVIQSVDNSDVVIDKDKSTMNLENKTSNNEDPHKNRICLVINNKQTKSNISTEIIDVHNPIKVDITDFESYNNCNKHNDCIENKNFNVINEQSISYTLIDESVFTKLYSPGQSSVDEVSNSININETRNKTTLNTQSNEISKQEINDNHQLISDDTENGKLSDSECEVIQSVDDSDVVMDKDKSTMNLENRTSNDEDPHKNRICLVINNKQTKSSISTETIDVHNPINVDITDFESYNNCNKHNDCIENKNSNVINEQSISDAKTNDESVSTKLDLPEQSTVDEVSNVFVDSSNTNETKTKTTLHTQSNEITTQEINDNNQLISTVENGQDNVTCVTPPSCLSENTTAVATNNQIKKNVLTFDKNVKIPLLNLEENVNKEVASEIDILQALRKEIFNETSTVLNTDAETPPLHQPKLSKVTHSHEIGNKKRISIENYKAKSTNTLPNSISPKVDKDDLCRKQRLKLREKQCERSNFMSKMSINDSSDEEDKSSLSFNDIYGNLGPKSPDHVDFADTGLKPPIIIPNDPLDEAITLKVSDIDMRKTLPVPNTEAIISNLLVKPLRIDPPIVHINENTECYSNTNKENKNSIDEPRLKPDVNLNMNVDTSDPITINTDIMSRQMTSDGGSSTQHSNSNSASFLQSIVASVMLQNVTRALVSNVSATVPNIIPLSMALGVPLTMQSLAPSMACMGNMTPIMTPNARTYEMTPRRSIENEDFTQDRHIYTPLFSSFDEHETENLVEKQRYDCNRKQNNVPYEEIGRQTGNYHAEWDNTMESTESYQHEWDDTRKKIDKRIPVWEDSVKNIEHYHPARNDPRKNIEMRIIPVWEDSRIMNNFATRDSYQQNYKDYRYDNRESYNRPDCPQTPIHSFGHLDCPSKPKLSLRKSDLPTARVHPFDRSDFKRSISQCGINSDPQRLKNSDYNNRDDGKQRRFVNDKNYDTHSYRPVQNNRSMNESNFSQKDRRKSRIRESEGRGRRKKSMGRFDRKSRYRDSSVRKPHDNDYESDKFHYNKHSREKRDRGNYHEKNLKNNSDSYRREYRNYEVEKPSTSYLSLNKSASMSKSDMTEKNNGETLTFDESTRKTLKNHDAEEDKKDNFDTRRLRTASVEKALVRDNITNNIESRFEPNKRIITKGNECKGDRSRRAASVGRELVNVKKNFRVNKEDLNSFKVIFDSKSCYKESQYKESRKASKVASSCDLLMKKHDSQSRKLGYNRDKCSDDNTTKDDRKSIWNDTKNYEIVYSSDNISKGKALPMGYGVKNYKIPKIKQTSTDTDISEATKTTKDSTLIDATIRTNLVKDSSHDSNKNTINAEKSMHGTSKIIFGITCNVGKQNAKIKYIVADVGETFSNSDSSEASTKKNKTKHKSSADSNDNIEKRGTRSPKKLLNNEGKPSKETFRKTRKRILCVSDSDSDESKNVIEKEYKPDIPTDNVSIQIKSNDSEGDMLEKIKIRPEKDETQKLDVQNSGCKKNQYKSTYECSDIIEDNPVSTANSTIKHSHEKSEAVLPMIGETDNAVSENSILPSRAKTENIKPKMKKNIKKRRGKNKKKPAIKNTLKNLQLEVKKSSRELKWLLRDIDENTKKDSSEIRKYQLSEIRYEEVNERDDSIVQKSNDTVENIQNEYIIRKELKEKDNLIDSVVLENKINKQYLSISPGPKCDTKPQDSDLHPYVFETDSVNEGNASESQTKSDSESESELQLSSTLTSKTEDTTEKKIKIQRGVQARIIKPNNGRKERISSNTDGSLEHVKNIPDFECFTDKSYCFQSKTSTYSCRLCKYIGSNIVAHYIKDHALSEIPLSRLSPGAAKRAIKQCKLVNFQAIRKMPTDKYTCRFCYKSFVKKELEKFFWHVVSMHTGEYVPTTPELHQCSEDLDTAKCPFSIDVPPPPAYAKGQLLGYICGKCNFTQVSIENLKKHVIMRHNDEITKVYTISLSLLSKKAILNYLKDLDNQNSALQGEELRTLGNIQTKQNVTECSNDSIRSNEKSKSPPESVRNIQAQLTLESDNLNKTSCSKLLPTDTAHETRKDLTLTPHSDVLNKDVKINYPEEMQKEADQVPSSDVFSYPHFKIQYTANGLKEYVCCINGNDNHYKTTHFISMKTHIQLKHSENWDGYCFMCKVIVTPQGTHQFKDCLHHYFDKHIDDFPIANNVASEKDLDHDKVIEATKGTECIDDPVQTAETGYLKPPQIVSTHNESQKLDESNPGMPIIESVKSLRTTDQSLPSPSYPSSGTPEVAVEYKYEEAQADIMSKKHCVVLDTMMTHVNLIQIFKCAGKFCAFTTDSTEEALLHSSTHVRIGGEYALCCVYCNYDASGNAIDLVTHVFKNHGCCPYVCEVCFYRAAASQLVQAHINRVHPNKSARVLRTPVVKGTIEDEICLPRKLAVPFYVCKGDHDTQSPCKFRAYTPRKFFEHMQQRHQNSKEFLCFICSQVLSSPSELIRHLKTHGLKLYQCTWCVYGADNETELLNHSSAKHPSKQPKAFLRIITTKQGSNEVKVLPLVHLDKNDITVLDIEPNVFTKNPVREAERAIELEKLVGETISMVDATFNTTNSNAGTTESIRKETNKPTEFAQFGILTPDAVNDGNDENYVNVSEEEKLSSTAPVSANDTFNIEWLYKCAKCHMIFESAQKLIAHVGVCCGENKISCAYCQAIIYKSQIVKHYKAHSRLYPFFGFICPLCNLRFETDVLAKEHFREFHRDINSNVIWTAQQFSEQATSKSLLQTNKNIVTQTNKIIETRPKRKRSLESKTKTIEPPEKLKKYGPQDIDKLPIKPNIDESMHCSLCDFSTKVKLQMVKHWQRHAQQQPVSETAPINPLPHLNWHCGLCQFKSLLRPQVVEHCAKLHNSKMQFKCGYCPFRTSNLENIPNHQSKSHEGKQEDIFYYYYREGSVPDDTDGTPCWMKQKQKMEASGSKIKTESIDPSYPPPPPPPKSVILPEPVPVVDLDLVIQEIEPEDHVDDLCQEYGEFCEPNGLKYKCPLCNNVTEDDEESMQSHLYEELKYRKWGCSVCSYKAFHYVGFREHMQTEHTQQQNREHLELPVDSRLETWVTKLLKYQKTIIEKNKENLAKQKAEIKRVNQSLIAESPKMIDTPVQSSPVPKQKLVTEADSIFGTFGEPSGELYCCPICYITFNEANDMQTHLESELNKMRWFCSSCPEIFQNYNEAQIHCRSVHTGYISRPIEVARDASLLQLRSTWVESVMQSQAAKIIKVRNSVSSMLQDATSDQNENSLLVVGLEQKVTTPDEKMAGRSSAPKASNDEQSQDDKSIKCGPLKKCPYCRYVKAQEKRLNKHILRHYNLKAYSCPYCGLDGNRKQVIKHQRICHPTMSTNIVDTMIPQETPEKYLEKKNEDTDKNSLKCLKSSSRFQIVEDCPSTSRNEDAGQNSTVKRKGSDDVLPLRKKVAKKSTSR